MRQIVDLALFLMSEHGLIEAGWTFGFNRRKTALGVCRFKPKRIELSRYFVLRNNSERIRKTILHEIAHAIAGPKAGHGPLWRAVARQIGADTERCSVADMPAGAWKATCDACGKDFSMHRKPKRNYLCKCRRGKVLIWEREAS